MKDVAKTSNPMGKDLDTNRLRAYAESSEYTTSSITIYTDIRCMAVELLRRRQDETSATLKECPWCHHSADSEGCIYHESNCAGLETVELNRLQHYMLTRASEKATTPREPPAATTFELNQDRSGCKHCGMLHGHHIVEDEYGRRDVCQRRAQNGSDALP